jgi:hypothetical protein
VNDRVPLEFNQLFESMKLQIKLPTDKIRMVGLCQDIDQNLGFLPKDQIFMLMKAEVIKDVLEHKFSKVGQFDVTNLLVKRLQDTFAKKERYLTPFSQWVARSIIAELEHRQNLGLITDKTFNPGAFDGEKRKDAIRFNRYLDYLLPWIDRLNSLSATDFNKLTMDVSWIILRRLNDRALLFKRFSSTAVSDTKINIFNIPARLTQLAPADIKQIQNDVTPTTLKEESEREKDRAQTEVDKVTPTDLSPLSDDLNRELEKKVP